ncbi:polyprenyl synthetase family protein [Sphingobacteriales bacterium UPWRP_1]|nr:isoprenyl synthetase [Sphingobacteriales bacterium TSM_CSM]PSJ76245.1 polyprenyl synthetase family protein [Sphingobacteriales bacterium UPWRP_1]
MRSFEQLQELFTHYLHEKKLPDTTSGLYRPINHIMDMGGKRIRPLLCLISCQMFTPEVEKALPPALAIEFFHNFTLVHDDIMDNAPLRRGYQTVHTQYGVNAAILSGDAMLIKTYEFLCESPKNCLPALLRTFNQTALDVCEGQQMDMNFENEQQVSMPQYLRMIELKTAVLLAAALKMGAIAGGARTPDAMQLFEFGRNIGIAFQLQDDLLDTFGEPGKTGKQTGGDILQNKKTFLLIKALETAGKEQRTILQHWLAAKRFQPNEKIAAVTDVFEQLGVKDAAKSTMQQYYNLAFEHLNHVSGNNEMHRLLTDLTRQLMNRQW